jgi:hypothetical protein
VYLNTVTADALCTVVPYAIMIMCPLLGQFFISSQPRDDRLLHELFTFAFDVLGLFETCTSSVLGERTGPLGGMLPLTFTSSVNVHLRAAHADSS